MHDGLALLFSDELTSNVFIDTKQQHDENKREKRRRLHFPSIKGVVHNDTVPSVQYTGT